MLVRCKNSGTAAMAYRAMLMIRMRMMALCDHNFHWQNAHPGNPKMQPESVWIWLTEQWKAASKADKAVLVSPTDVADFDANTCEYRLWYIRDYPTNKLIGKRIRTDGTFNSHENWIARLRESIAKHGIKDPLLAWCHVPSQVVVGQPKDTPNIVLGNNRVAIAQADGIPTVPLIVSYPRGYTKPPFGSDYERITFEDLHDRFMGHRADLWVTPSDWYLVHPPSVFYDEQEGGLKNPSPL